MTTAEHVLAINLTQGDQIIREGSIPLTVRDTDQRTVIAGMVAVAYDCVAGSGTRVFPATQRVSVLRPEIEAH